jgi:hypothetical protein
MVSRFLLALSLATALAIPAPAFANDSTATLGAGGLQLVRTLDIELLSEDLYVSTAEVRVTYHFRNQADKPLTYVVAFPLPAIDSTVPEAMNVMLPDPGKENFVDFTVTVDGQSVTPSVSARAFALGVDRTDMLKAYGLPLNPMTEGLFQRLEKLPKDEQTELNRVGLILADDYNVDAAWRLEQAFYWEQTFPPGKEVVVEHRYKPVVGYSFFGDYVFTDLNMGYRTKYCMDDAFVTAAKAKLAAIANKDTPYLDERRISYILTTANNWSGPIGKFRLVVDKGIPEALVSFCGTDVKKISPTQFEMTATDFAPEQELEILLAVPHKEP